jgi:hypothetical protein
MTLQIPGLREKVLSDKTSRDLGELLKFRHFKRYYFEFEYDWDCIDFLLKKVEEVRRLHRIFGKSGSRAVVNHSTSDQGESAGPLAAAPGEARPGFRQAEGPDLLFDSQIDDSHAFTAPAVMPATIRLP